MPLPARHIAVSIDRPAAEVYAFASNPQNLPKWAAGVSSGVRKQGGAWITDSPMGPVTIAFAPENSFGVLDHDVTLPDGTVFANPMRVFPNADGCEVIFTLLRRPAMTDEEYAADGHAIETDLRTLKTLMETA